MRIPLLLLTLAVSAALVLALSGHLPVEPPPEQMPERILMATDWLDDRTEEGARELVRAMNRTGANSIAIGVHDTNILFFGTGSSRIPQRDIFPAIIEEAHGHGMDVYAWTDTLNFPELLDEHPEWEFVTCVRSGRYHYPSDCGWHQRLSPFNPGIEDFIEEYYQDLASLDIDGIQFQDDLFLAEGEDWSDHAQEAFLEEYGHPPDPRNPSDQGLMQELKIERITELTRLAMDSASGVSPNLTFVFDVLPEPSRDRMLNWWSIDLGAIKDAGVDYFGIMSYHPQIMDDMRTDLEGAMDYLDSAFVSISTQVGSSRVIYRAWTTEWEDNTEPLPASEMDYVLERMERAGAYSVGYVPHHPKVESYSFFQRFPEEG